MKKISGQAHSSSAFFSWSGGKDSMLALHRALAQGYDVRALLAMLDASGARSRSHALAPELLAAQADALGIELVTASADWSDYETVFVAQLERFAAQGIGCGLFGDIDLQPHRDWEEKVCARAGLAATLPLWGEARRALVDEFLGLGYRAIVVCVNGRFLDARFASRAFDARFIADLPPGVDACGENGEFHTCVIDGPRFARPLSVDIAERYSIDLPAAQGGGVYHYARLALAR